MKLKLGLSISAVSRSILKFAIVAYGFPSNLTTHKSLIFTIIAPRGVAKLETSPNLTIFPSPVSYYLISDQCLKGNR